MPTKKEQRFIDYVLAQLDDVRGRPYGRKGHLTEAGAVHADVSIPTARNYLKKMLVGPLTVANIRGTSQNFYSDPLVARRDRVDWEQHGQVLLAYVRQPPH